MTIEAALVNDIVTDPLQTNIRRAAERDGDALTGDHEVQGVTTRDGVRVTD